MGIVKESVIYILNNERKNISTILKMIGLDGGEGSGNFGHSGRPGHVGGSAKRGGYSGSESEEVKAELKEVLKAKSKVIQKERNEFKKKSFMDKVDFGIAKGFIPQYDFMDFIEKGTKKGMSDEKFIDYCAARYFTAEKFKRTYVAGMKPFYGSTEYKTPLKPTAPQTKELFHENEKVQRIMDDLGVDKKTAIKMKAGLSKHFGNGNAIDPWIDKYIDGDSRYEGAIYRWKGYPPEIAEEKMKKLVPGAKIQNTHGSNWSFSSDPYASSGFGGYESPDHTTIRYVCYENKTASPVQHLSGFGEGEAEVIPHSQTTWTIQSVDKKQKPNGGIMYEIHMTEDDWHEEKNIPVWQYAKEQEEWKKNFPKDGNEIDEIFQKVKDDHDGEAMKEFLEKCPSGTEIISLEKNTILHKEDGEWWGVEFDFDSMESWEDVAWENVKDYAVPLNGSSVQNTAWVWDSYVYNVPNSEKTFEELEKEFEQVKHIGGMTNFLNDAPVGTTFNCGIHDFIFKKNENGDWVDVSGVLEPKSSYDIISFMDTDNAKLIDTSTIEETAPIKLPTSYGDFESALLDLTSAQNYKGTELYLDSLPDGTQLWDEEEEIAWEKDGDSWFDTWDKSNKMDTESIAKEVVDKQSYSCESYPFEKPKDVNEANKMLTDLQNNKPEKLGELVVDCPAGTTISTSPNGGFVFKKTSDGWKKIDTSKVVDYVSPSYYNKHEDAAETSNGVEVTKQLKAGYSWIMQWGEQDPYGEEW